MTTCRCGLPMRSVAAEGESGPYCYREWEAMRAHERARQEELCNARTVARVEAFLREHGHKAATSCMQADDRIAGGDLDAIAAERALRSLLRDFGIGD